VEVEDEGKILTISLEENVAFQAGNVEIQGNTENRI
jgi:hypothetical protein